MAKIIHLSYLHPRNDSRIARHVELAGAIETLVIAPEAVRRRNKLTSFLIYGLRGVMQITRKNSRELVFVLHDPLLLLLTPVLSIRSRCIFDSHEDYSLRLREGTKNGDGALKRLLYRGISLAYSRIGLKWCEKTIRSVPSIYPEETTRCMTVYNSPLIRQEVAKTFRDIDSKRNGLRFVLVGNISEDRGLNELIRFGDYCTRKGFHLDICGYCEEFEKEAGSMSEWINYHGWCSENELDAVMKRSDIGICPLPLTEAYKASYPIKIAEYLSYGMRVLSSDIDIARELSVRYRCVETLLKEEWKEPDTIVWRLAKRDITASPSEVLRYCQNNGSEYRNFVANTLG